MIGALGAALILAATCLACWVVLAGPWRAVDRTKHAPPPHPLLAGGVDIAKTREAFAQHVYGPPPPRIAPVVSERKTIPPEQAAGVRGVEQWRIELGAAGHFHLAIVRPPGDAPAPVILTLNFAGNRAAFPGRPEAIAGPVGCIQWFCRYGFGDPISRLIFGPHINGPPFELIAQRGYAVALLYAGDIVPDDEAHARAALARFAPSDTGALMAWAWTASRALDVLAADPRFDAKRIAVWGQSRQGKAALVAGAFDERFAETIALQSGRGGDAPNRAFEGEPIAQMRSTFPHWFSPRYSEAAPVEQHQLLALIAPRPLLVGHALRDAWADPVGARAVREAAAPAFKGRPINHFIRDGQHGIMREDWLQTLDFLDAAFRASPASRSDSQ